MNKKIVTLIIVILLIFGAGALIYYESRNGKNFADSALAHAEAIVYKTATCGCCANYVGYLGQQGLEVTAKNLFQEELDQLKNEHGIPENMWSCHTTFIGDHVVEGHIPLEAVEKLISENPDDIVGIAMPGMPSGSPGMPGAKTGPFEIYSLGHSGELKLFTSL